MTLIDAKNISDTYNRLIALKAFLDSERSITRSYVLTARDRDDIPRTIAIKRDQVKTLLKELEKEYDMLQSTLDHSQIIIEPNELTMEKE